MLDSELGPAGLMSRTQPENRILEPQNDLPRRGWCQVHIKRVHIEGLKELKDVNGLEHYQFYEE